MPPRRVPPMMGHGRGLNQPQNPFMMQRPQRGPSPFGGRQSPPYNNGMRGFGMQAGRQPRGTGGGLLGKILGKNNPQASRGAGGGLLSRFLGGGSKGSGALSGFEAASRSGAGLSSLSQPGGLMNILNQTQSVLKTASQIGPMVQQYGPLVRNLPAMWKLYRGLKSASTEEDANETQADDKETKDESIDFESLDFESLEVSEPSIQEKKKKPKRSNKSKKNSGPKGSSLPKLYI
ncbi:hypothetical protein GCM10008967_34560 [Bacillus carboniphilus]|uniref:YqfQ-like protein n=1 Tax=Bacillus carboniphilus TaxID=86663 RepID=A0ABP3GBU1_9BACI